MRIIHFADLHIGVDSYGRPLPDRAWNSRLQDFLDAFDALVDYAIGDGVDAVIFAGDAYKSREPTQTHQREFAKRIQRLSTAGIPTFLLVGNHDLPNAEGRAHALEIYRTLEVPNVVTGDDGWFGSRGFRPVVLQTKSGPLQVAFVPWPQVGRIVASHPQAGSLSIGQIHQLVEEELTALIKEQARQLDPDIPAILTCHVSINDFLVQENLGSEQWMTIGTAPTLLKSNLNAEAFDYVALGHHHNNMELGMRTPTWYSGSMQPVDFGERKQDKGFMVFDIDSSRPPGQRIGGSGLPRLQAVPSRRFIELEVKPKTDDPTEEVCAAIERAKVRDAIVRVTVLLTHEQAPAMRIPDARRLLEEAHFVAGLRVQLPDQPRTLLPAGVQPDAASPLEALEIYFKTKQMEEARRAKLLAAAKDLVESVEQGAGV